jgi:F-type H+-transporting ATPase subunit gamma
MTDVQSTKKRAKSVANIGRITKSLEMVSAISVKQAEKRLGHRQPFITELTALLNTLPIDTDKPLPFLGSQTGKTLLIVITSNRGLVGGLYQDLFRKVREEFTNEEVTGIELMLFGEKGYALKDLGMVTHDWSHEETVEALFACEEAVVHGWMEKQYSQVYVCFSEFVSLTQFVPRIHKLLPLSEVSGSVDSRSCEPNGYTVYEQIAKMYIEEFIAYAVIAGTTSEHAARMMAMKNASDNSNELAEILKQMANTARQEAVTEAILEGAFHH